jgi:hypothetical protein
LYGSQCVDPEEARRRFRQRYLEISEDGDILEISEGAKFYVDWLANKKSGFSKITQQFK